MVGAILVIPLPAVCYTVPIKKVNSFPGGSNENSMLVRTHFRQQQEGDSIQGTVET